ncbi:MAG: cadmium-translocating P-type ATPase [Cyanobacteria bacterium SID2]|nr:cadmium-translocating P-type ATPase [Cyanobacteria bacterium SID2]
MSVAPKPQTSGCSCHGEPSTAATSKGRQRERLLLLGATIWFALGLVLLGFEVLSGTWEMLWFAPAYLVVGWDVLKTAGRNILRGRAFDETFLMSVATMGAIAIGEIPEAVGVMLFYRIGEAVQDLAVDRSRDSIRSLLAVRPDVANLKTPEGLRSVSPKTVKVGEVIVVKPGERIPLDGEVLQGSSYLDLSALTGESVPKQVRPGERVLAGTINQTGVLTVRVTQLFGESSIVRILELVENARNQKAPTEKFITRFARRYTPIVVGLAMAIATIPPLVLPGATVAEWFYRALILLVISCPCGLVISIPLGYFGGVGGAAKRGILVKGSVFLDRLATLKTVVFDKTGTLTEGTFEVTQIQPHEGWDAEAILRLAALAESHSNHPIARSICRASNNDSNGHAVADYSEIAGCGVRATVRDGSIDRSIAVGNARLVPGAENSTKENGGTVVRVAVDDRYAGDIVVSDRLRDDAVTAVTELRALGVDRIVMLTGDERTVADSVARSLALDDVCAELLPEEKAAALERVLRDRQHHGSVAFVGDGINDAPSIALADVGIAMGGLGSDAAIETADVVLMLDAPSKLAEALEVSRRTRRIVWQNIAFALGVKGLVVVLGIFGLATMWAAVFADVGVALLAVANASRVLFVKS